MDNINNWRDVTTPPEEKGTYLVYKNSHPLESWCKWKFSVERFDGKRWVINYHGEISHWMPLPKPPGE